MTVDATRRRAIGQILLLAAGFLVLVAISASSVIFVNKAREDSGLVVHTVEVENQINALLLEIRRAESAARGYLLTLGPEFLDDHNKAVATIKPAVEMLAQSTADNPVQVESANKLRIAVKRRLDQFAREMDLIKQNQLPMRSRWFVRRPRTTAAARFARSRSRCAAKKIACSWLATMQPTSASVSPRPSPSQARRW